MNRILKDGSVLKKPKSPIAEKRSFKRGSSTVESSQKQVKCNPTERKSKSKPMLMTNAAQAKILSKEYDASKFAVTFDNVVSPKKDDLPTQLSLFKPKATQKRESQF